MITIHASTLPSYNDCPRRSATRIIYWPITEAGFTLNKTPNGIGAAVGTAFHKSASTLMQGKLNGTGAALSDAQEIAINNYREKIIDGVDYDAITPNNNDAEKQIRVISGEFFNNILPVVNPVEIETRHLAQVSPEYELSGTPDVISDSGSVEDWKCGAVLRPYHQQLGGYSLLRRSHGSPQPRLLRMHHIPRVSVKKNFPGITTHDYNVSFAEVEARAVINQIMRDVGNFLKTKSRELKPQAFPANTMSVLCSQKYCSAFNTEFCALTLKQETLGSK